MVNIPDIYANTLFYTYTHIKNISRYLFQPHHLEVFSWHTGLFFYNITPRCFFSHLGCPNTCLCSGFALIALPPSYVGGKFWHPFRHVLLLSCIQPLILITSWLTAPAGLTQLGLKLIPTSPLSPCWAVKVGQRFSDWCISQSGGLFRWVASYTNNDTWWKPLSLNHDGKWRWIALWMESDFVEQVFKNVFVLIMMHSKHMGILKH